MKQEREMRHVYVPERNYPWFCSKCGYAEHERLRHVPATDDEQAKRELSKEDR